MKNVEKNLKVLVGFWNNFGYLICLKNIVCFEILLMGFLWISEGDLCGIGLARLRVEVCNLELHFSTGLPLRNEGIPDVLILMVQFKF